MNNQENPMSDPLTPEAVDDDLLARLEVVERERDEALKRLRAVPCDISAEVEAHMTDAMFGRRRA